MLRPMSAVMLSGWIGVGESMGREEGKDWSDWGRETGGYEGVREGRGEGVREEGVKGDIEADRGHGWRVVSSTTPLPQTTSVLNLDIPLIFLSPHFHHILFRLPLLS